MLDEPVVRVVTQLPAGALVEYALVELVGVLADVRVAAEPATQNRPFAPTHRGVGEQGQHGLVAVPGLEGGGVDGGGPGPW